MTFDLRSLTFHQIMILKELRSHQSLRSLCSALNISVSNISRDLQDLNTLLQMQILKTSPKGYLLTEEGGWASELATEIWEKAEGFVAKGTAKAESTALPTHTVGGRGYINLLAAQKFSSHTPLSNIVRLRYLDLPPTEVIQLAIMGVIDSIIHFESFDLPSSWMTQNLIEKVPWKIHLSKDHPLLHLQRIKALDYDDLAEYPFVVSTYWNGREVATQDDGFPLPWSRRKKGSEAQTALTALQISAKTNQLTFLPNVFEGLLAENSIETLDLGGLISIEKPLQISVHTQRVSLKVFNQMIQSFKMKSYEIEQGDTDENDSSHKPTLRADQRSLAGPQLSSGARDSGFGESATQNYSPRQRGN